MNTTNNKLRSNQNKFRSSTDVNNYNKFLLELDNKQMKLIKETKEVQKIDDYLKHVNQVYEKYTLPINQTNKKTDIVDPNMYISVDPNKVAFIYEKRKQIQDLLDLKRDKEKNDFKKEEEKKREEEREEETREEKR